MAGRKRNICMTNCYCTIDELSDASPTEIDSVQPPLSTELHDSMDSGSPAQVDSPTQESLNTLDHEKSRQSLVTTKVNGLTVLQGKVIPMRDDSRIPKHYMTVSKALLKR